MKQYFMLGPVGGVWGRFSARLEQFWGLRWRTLEPCWRPFSLRNIAFLGRRRRLSGTILGLLGATLGVPAPRAPSPDPWQSNHGRGEPIPEMEKQFLDELTRSTRYEVGMLRLGWTGLGWQRLSLVGHMRLRWQGTAWPPRTRQLQVFYSSRFCWCEFAHGKLLFGPSVFFRDESLSPRRPCIKNAATPADAGS